MFISLTLPPPVLPGDTELGSMWAHLLSNLLCILEGDPRKEYYNPFPLPPVPPLPAGAAGHSLQVFVVLISLIFMTSKSCLLIPRAKIKRKEKELMNKKLLERNMDI